jgi:hypothetical protein
MYVGVVGRPAKVMRQQMLLGKETEMNNQDQLRQLTLWPKEVLDALEVPSGCHPDSQGGTSLECQPAQQEGQLTYIQLFLPLQFPEMDKKHVLESADDSPYI